MRYSSIREAAFIRRLNRFVAEVELDGRIERVHVKNTGRCAELLVPGYRVYLAGSGNPARKTAYDLIGVDKPVPGGTRYINMTPWPRTGRRGNGWPRAGWDPWRT